MCYALCADFLCVMRDVLCAMRRFPMRHARCVMCCATISYALRDNFLCVMRDVLYAMRWFSMGACRATKQKHLTGDQRYWFFKGCVV